MSVLWWKKKRYYLCGVGLLCVYVTLWNCVDWKTVEGYMKAPCYLTDTEIARMKRLLYETATILEKNRIRYWLDYGTLLGAIRDKGIIPHDKDMDIGMYAKEYVKFKQLDDTFRAKSIRRYGGTLVWEEDYSRFVADRESIAVKLEIFRYTKLSTNIGEIYRKGEVLDSPTSPFYVRIKNLIERHTSISADAPAPFFDKLEKTAVIDNRTYYAPSRADEYLTFRYSKNWRIPSPYKPRCFIPV